jgi:hypothetical protein
VHVISYLILLLYFGFSLSSCDRKSEEHSQLKILVPQKSSFNTNWPNLDQLCWGANITGEGIKNYQPAGCAFQWGLIGGMVESGKQIELTVPRGPKRKIEVFVWQKLSAQTCLSHQQLTVAELQALYKVGEVKSFDIVKSIETIDVDVNFPSDSKSWLTTLGQEKSCNLQNVVTPEPEQPSSSYLKVSYGIGTDEGNQYKMKIRMNYSPNIGGDP